MADPTPGSTTDGLIMNSKLFMQDHFAPWLAAHEWKGKNFNKSVLPFTNKKLLSN